MHLQNHRRQQVTIADYKLVVVDESKLWFEFPFLTLSFNQTLPLFTRIKPNPDSSSLDPIDFPEAFLIGSLDGLVCLGVYRELDLVPTLLFMTPMTGACKRLASYGHGFDFSVGDPSGFYFDSFNNDYRLLCVFSDGDEGAAVYSYRLDSWRDIKFKPRHKDIFRTWLSPATFYGQGLYFNVVGMVKDDDEFGCHVVRRIIRFDVKTEKCKEISLPPPPPPPHGATDYYFAGLVVLKGCLHLCLTYPIDRLTDGVVVLMMKDDAGDDWEMLRAFTLSQEQPPLICTETIGDWLAVLDECDNSFTKLSTEEFTTRYPCFSYAPKDYASARMIYVETLVNP